ncbi:hypothetical protein lerEdw1_005716 [Lerista edwardsae]|nr:hypothetical protein lerEdw1_005717 [Lerista edwardsae]KAJ6650614.1 hypothetical protein lerEdw1_005716 [Lerista edwardsae]
MRRLPYDVILYLDAVDAVCRAAETEGRSTIPRPYSKRDLIDLIVVMYHQASSALSFMLGMLLAEDPTWKHLQRMLGHFTAFLNAEDPETQVEALIMAGSLERLAARCGIYQLEGAQEVNIELHH